MERIYKIMLFLMLAVAIPLSLASGQEKKSENKIKVVIDNGSGPETVLDTTITGGEIPKTITLKNGKVIFITEPEKIIMSDSGKGKVVVTIASSGEGEKEKKEKIIIMSEGNNEWTSVTDDDDNKYVYAYSRSKGKGDKSESHVIVTSKDVKDGEKKTEKSIVIKNGKVITRDGEDKFDIYIESDKNSDSETTSYIIARDGLVVTVEGNDEAKVKELSREIEKKLGIRSDEEGKETGTTKSGKSVKK
jgi:hypothetical protein